jgi:hypothetical protein
VRDVVGAAIDAIDPIVCYNPETYLFLELARRFAKTGQLGQTALYLILDWKAPRARTRRLARLSKLAGGDFERAAREIATDLVAATSQEKRMGVVLTKGGFRLPTASAIPAVLYPETFTVYKAVAPESIDKRDFLEPLKGVMRRGGVPLTVIESLFSLVEAASATAGFRNLPLR